MIICDYTLYDSMKIVVSEHSLISAQTICVSPCTFPLLHYSNVHSMRSLVLGSIGYHHRQKCMSKDCTSRKIGVGSF